MSTARRDDPTDHDDALRGGTSAEQEARDAAERAERWRVRFIGLALALLCLGIFVGKTAWDGTSALARGDEEARRGALDLALASWEEAARAYLPGAAYAGMAHRRLLELGDDAAAHGELARADRAYAAVCRAIADTAWAITPYAEELARAERGRAELRRGNATAALSGKRTGGLAKRSRARAAAEPARAEPAAAALAATEPMAPRLAAARHARTWAGVGFLGLLGVGAALTLLRRAGVGRGRDVVLRTRWAALVLAGSAGLFALGAYQL